MLRIDPKWPCTLHDRRYIIYVILVSSSHKFHSVFISHFQDICKIFQILIDHILKFSFFFIFISQFKEVTLLRVVRWNIYTEYGKKSHEWRFLRKRVVRTKVDERTVDQRGTMTNEICWYFQGAWGELRNQASEPGMLQTGYLDIWKLCI